VRESVPPGTSYLLGTTQVAGVPIDDNGLFPLISGLNVGDPAPDFVLAGSDGKTYSLSDFKGKQAVVIAWFPKAFTGG